jgi:hypothetical protein
MVNFICSEWIPSENIPFKIGIFIDWEVVRLPPPEGGCLRRACDGVGMTTMYSYLTMIGWR